MNHKYYRHRQLSLSLILNKLKTYHKSNKYDPLLLVVFKLYANNKISKKLVGSILKSIYGIDVILHAVHKLDPFIDIKYNNINSLDRLASICTIAIYD